MDSVPYFEPYSLRTKVCPDSSRESRLYVSSFMGFAQNKAVPGVSGLFIGRTTRCNDTQVDNIARFTLQVRNIVPDLARKSTTVG